jgi:hypothetical protein
LLPHRKVPLLHLNPQVPLDEQVAVAFAGVPLHGEHAWPQESVLVVDTHAPEHEWNPVPQPQVCADTSHVWFVAHWVSKAQPGLHWWDVRSQ